MKSKPDPVDVHVGARLRHRRTFLGMSQEKLGEAVSLTFQQIQKYERATNRIGASRLWHLAQVLDVPVEYMFDGLAREAIRARGFAHPAQEGYEGEDHLSRRETLELVRAYYRVTDPTVRKRILDLVKAIGEAPDDDLEATTHK